jgi:hypothetical protein
MSEVFEGYERQYCEISAALSRKCAAASALDGGAYPSPRQNLLPSAAPSFRLLLYPGLISPFSMFFLFTREEEAEAVRDPGRRAGVRIAGKNDGTEFSVCIIL